MKVAVLLPVTALPAGLMAQPIAAVSYRYRHLPDGSVTFLALPQTIGHYAEIIAGGLVIPVNATSLSDYDEVIYANISPSRSYSAPLPDSVRGYTLEDTGRIVPFNRHADEQDDSGQQAHTFNRLGPRRSDTAAAHQYFPWSGYLYREYGWGPINEVGHRYSHDLRELAERPANHKVIACFGGSSAWGWGCLPFQVWSAVLEDLLNRHVAENGIDLRFTVLNMAGPGMVILNEIFNYVLYCHRLKPDIVISHSGINDLHHAQVSDPYLLRQHDITYQEPMERWAQLIHGTDDEAMVYPPNPPRRRSINQPGAVLSAYMARLRQFRLLVEGGGGQFVWGLQPMLWSKKELAGPEEPIMTQLRTGSQNADLERQYQPMYELLSTRLPPEDKTVMVNHHRLFHRFGKHDWLFWDLPHTNPSGNVRIAEAYLDHLIANNLPVMLGGK